MFLNKKKQKKQQTITVIRNNYSQEQISLISNYIEQCTQIFAQKYQTDFAQVAMFGDFIQKNNIPSHGFETNFASILTYHGWFIFASGWGGFMPKLHQERCLLTLDTWDCEKQYKLLTRKNKEKNTQKQFSNKSLKRMMKKVYNLGDEYTISLNTNFDEAMEMTNKFQEKNQGCTWVEKKLVQVLQDMNAKPLQINGVIIQSISWEVRTKNGTLVAADIGYQVGGIYASMTGFSDRKYPGLGIVQLLAQGSILKSMGFNLWDFGMSMQYKLELGAKNYSRQNYLMRQKIAKTIKINSINEETYKIQLQNQPLPLNQIPEFKKIGESNFVNQKSKFKRSKQIWEQIRNIEKINLENWDQNTINQWLNLRFQNNNQQNINYPFQKFDDLTDLESVFAKLKIKNKSKNIVKIANRLKNKKNKPIQQQPKKQQHPDEQ